MRARALFGLLIPCAFAALFVRLGVWQYSRHVERQAFNAGLAVRLEQPAVPFDSLGAEGSEWRRVSLSGRFRYDLEQVQGPRTNAGSPGVHLLTPLERPRNDTLVIVTRGWVYSADGGAVDLARWHEGDTVSIQGYVVPLAAEASRPSASGRPLRTLNHPELAARIGAPIARAHVVMTSDSAARIDSVPRRLAMPVPDGGPHFSYMLQWFGFALVALVGGIALYRRQATIVGPEDTA